MTSHDAVSRSLFGPRTASSPCARRTGGAVALAAALTLAVPAGAVAAPAGPAGALDGAGAAPAPQSSAGGLEFDPGQLAYVRGPVAWNGVDDIRLYIEDAPEVADVDGATARFFLSDGTEPRATALQFRGVRTDSEGPRAGQPYLALGFASEDAARAELPSSLEYPRALTWYQADALRGFWGVDHYPLAVSLETEDWDEGELDPVVLEDGSIRLRLYALYAATMDVHILPEDYEAHGPDVAEWRTFPTYAMTRTAKNYYETVLPAEHQGAKFQAIFTDAQPYQPIWRVYPLWVESGDRTYPCADGTGVCLPAAAPSPEEPEAPEVPELPEAPVIERSSAALAPDNDTSLLTTIAIPEGAEVFTGDFDGDGVDTVAWRIGNHFTFPGAGADGAARTMWYGNPGDTVLVGDWNSDGIDTIAIHRDNVVHVRNDFRGGNASNTYAFGLAGEQLLAGDWNGDGRDTIAVRRGNTVYAADKMLDNRWVHTFTVGADDTTLVVGDVDGDGRDTVLAYRDGAFVTDPGDDAAPVIAFGRTGDVPLLGSWEGSTGDSVGVFRP